MHKIKSNLPVPFSQPQYSQANLFCVNQANGFFSLQDNCLTHTNRVHPYGNLTINRPWDPFRSNHPFPKPTKHPVQISVGYVPRFPRDSKQTRCRICLKTVGRCRDMSGRRKNVVLSNTEESSVFEDETYATLVQMVGYQVLYLKVQLVFIVMYNF